MAPTRSLALHALAFLVLFLAAAVSAVGPVAAQPQRRSDALRERIRTIESPETLKPPVVLEIGLDRRD